MRYSRFKVGDVPSPRHLWWLILVLLLSNFVQGSPIPPGGAPAKNRKVIRDDARKYAQQINFFTEQVAQHYYRPIGRDELLEAALLALYDAARIPAPRDLKSQFRQAISLTSTLRAQSIQPQALVVSERYQMEPVEKLLAQLREEIGEALSSEGESSVLISVKAIGRKLDPHSGVVTAAEQRKSVAIDHESIGVGVTFKETNRPGLLQIDVVYPGGPAQRAGLRPGDVLTKIDDQPVADVPPAKLMALRGTKAFDDVPALTLPNAPNTPTNTSPSVLKVSYRRGGQGAERSTTLLRERFRTETVQGVRRRDDNSWDWLVSAREGLAHVRITNLGRGTADELRDVVMALQQQRKMKGMILDLRWCPGGYLNEAVEVADLFLGTCVIATIKNRNREDTVYRSTDEAKPRSFPLVVLVNGQTSGGAELIAAALQDHKRAVVVGQRTLGKASVQTPLAIGLEGIGFKLTSGTFVRPSGKNLHRFPESGALDDWGVLPDEDARLSRDLGLQLQQWWHTLALRPARSTERHPLDDPRSDPQQLLALSALRKLIP